jgi:hypothetical protein
MLIVLDERREMNEGKIHDALTRIRREILEKKEGPRIPTSG